MKMRAISKSILLASLLGTFSATPAHANAFEDFFNRLFHVGQTPSQPAPTPGQQTPAPETPAPAAPAPALLPIPVQVQIPAPLPTPLPTPVPTPIPVDPCSELQVGDSRVIDYPLMTPEVYADQVMPQFLLKRVSDNAKGQPAYEAVLQINFVPDAGETPDTAAMLAFTANCYANLPPIEDPIGQSIKIRLAQAGEKAPVRNINLTDQHMDREDMIDWSTQSNCRTITHESLHLLGLVDLYQEPVLKASDGHLAYDCRSVGPTDSVMRDLYASHFDTEIYMSNGCSCETTACANQLAKITEAPSACPSLADTESNRLTMSPYDIATNPTDAAEFKSTYASELTTGKFIDKWAYVYLSIAPDTHPFLYPAEFRMITAPACHEKNALYYQCATNAYRTSTTDGCKATPSACSDPNTWLQ